jgi:hypothetical protein
MHCAVRPSCALVGLLVVTAGCPGTLEDPERFIEAGGGVVTPQGTGDAAASGEGGQTLDAATCPDIPTAVFQAKCTSSGCHNSQDKSQGLDLQSSGVSMRLVGVAATEGPGLLVDPGTPSHSVLYTKLTTMPPFGARMPLGSSLDEATIACVLSWVEEVANGARAGASEAGVGGDAAADAP